MEDSCKLCQETKKQKQLQKRGHEHTPLISPMSPNCPFHSDSPKALSPQSTSSSMSLPTSTTMLPPASPQQQHHAGQYVFSAVSEPMLGDARDSHSLVQSVDTELTSLRSQSTHTFDSSRSPTTAGSSPFAYSGQRQQVPNQQQMQAQQQQQQQQQHQFLHQQHQQQQQQFAPSTQHQQQLLQQQQQQHQQFVQQQFPHHQIMSSPMGSVPWSPSYATASIPNAAANPFGVAASSSGLNPLQQNQQHFGVSSPVLLLASSQQAPSSSSATSLTEENSFLALARGRKVNTSLRLATVRQRGPVTEWRLRQRTRMRWPSGKPGHRRTFKAHALKLDRINVDFEGIYEPNTSDRQRLWSLKRKRRCRYKVMPSWPSWDSSQECHCCVHTAWNLCAPDVYSQLPLECTEMKKSPLCTDVADHYSLGFYLPTVHVRGTGFSTLALSSPVSTCVTQDGLSAKVAVSDSAEEETSFTEDPAATNRAFRSRLSELPLVMRLLKSGSTAPIECV